MAKTKTWIPSSMVDAIYEKNANVPFVKRIMNLDTRSIPSPYTKGEQSTHLMSSTEIDGKYYIYPEVMDVNGVLTHVNNPIEAYKAGEVIEFPTQQMANLAAENYKQGKYWSAFTKAGAY